MIYVGLVKNINDSVDGCRIQARIRPHDNQKLDADLPWAFPKNPKYFHILPHVGEIVLIELSDDDNPNGQRYYTGPILSQYQMLQHDTLAGGATALLDGGSRAAFPSLSRFPEAIGTFPKKNEIAILGRKKSDIILSDDDLRIRCGSRVTDYNGLSNFAFNKLNPSFIKLKHYDFPIEYKTDVFKNQNFSSHSTASIVANDINLISTGGQPDVNYADRDEQINDEEMRKVLSELHLLPYGDELCYLLESLIKMFKSHTHKYSQLPPCPDVNSNIFDKNYGFLGEQIRDKILSQHIRIN